MLLGDPLRLKQVLVNLSNNAIKFTFIGGVKIRVKLDKEMVQQYKLLFEVEDSGIGISPENQKKLFQSSTSTTDKYGNPKLGLATSKKLIQLMNGEIGVRSSEGKGSTFWFTAIFKGAEIMNLSEELVKEISDPDQLKLKILIAEDNVINQKVCVLNIKKLGHEVVAVNNGIEAVNSFAKMNFDLILMDIQMPGMDGLKATEAIRKIEQENGVEKRIPIIATTANLFKEDVKRFMENGMDDHLGKPFKPSELEMIIERNLKRP